MFTRFMQPCCMDSISNKGLLHVNTKKSFYSVIRNISLSHVDMNIETNSILLLEQKNILWQGTEAKLVEHTQCNCNWGVKEWKYFPPIQMFLVLLLHNHCRKYFILFTYCVILDLSHNTGFKCTGTGRIQRKQALGTK